VTSIETDSSIQQVSVYMKGGNSPLQRVGLDVWGLEGMDTKGEVADI
jgi:hypothetical protein